MNEAATGKAPEYRYAAFISYRHVEPDRKWAQWLHTALETYRVPRKLVKEKGIAPRVGRVFRDEEELPASADLTSSIESALQQSRFLIVVCSRHTPKSEWVNKEVVRFRELGRDERVLALLIDGEPHEAFPRSLCEIRRTVIDADGQNIEQIEDIEPLAADVRSLPHRRESQRYLRRMGKLRILACFLGCSFDDLRQRDHERYVRWLKVLGALAFAILLTIGALTTVAIWQRHSALAAQQEKEEKSYLSVMLLANSHFDEQNYVRARETLWETPEHLRNWEWGYLLLQCRHELLSLEGHTKPVVYVDFSPDNRRVVTASEDKTAKIWDVESGKEIHTFKECQEAVFWAQFDSDGKRLAICCANGQMDLWDIDSGEKVVGVEDKEAHGYRHGSFSRDGKVFMSPSGKLWEVASGKERAAFPAKGRSAYAAAVSRDGRYAVTAASDTGDSSKVALSLWDVKNGRLIKRVVPGISGTSYVRFSPDASRVVAWGWGSAALWNVQGVEEPFRLWGKAPDFVRSVSLSPDGSWVAGACDPFLHVWDALTGEVRYVGDKHKDKIQSVAFSSDSTRLVTASWDTTARIWDTRTGVQLGMLVGHDCAVNCATFSPDRKLVVTASNDGFAKLWDPIPLSQSSIVSGSTSSSFHFAKFSPDGKRLLAISGYHWQAWDLETGKLLNCFRRGVEDTHFHRLTAWFDVNGDILTAGYCSTSAEPRRKEIVVREALTGRQLVCLSGHDEDVERVTVSCDGRLLATSGKGETRVWQVEKGVQLTRLQTGSIFCFSPDGRCVAASEGEHAVSIWDARTGALMRRLLGHSGAVVGASFNAKGTQIVTASRDTTSKVWDVATGKELATLGGHRASVTSASFNPDGSRVVTASQDATAMVWDTKTGTRLITLPLSELEPWVSKGVVCAGFSPDGRRVVMVPYCGSILIWDAAPFRNEHLPGSQSMTWAERFRLWQKARYRDWKKRGRLGEASNASRLAGAVELRPRPVSVTAAWCLSDIEQAALSQDGTIVLVSGHGRERTVDIKTGRERTDIQGRVEKSPPRDQRSNLDGSRKVTVSGDGTVTVSDSQTGRRLLIIKGHSDRVSTAILDPTGSRVVTISDDCTAKFWNTNTGKESFQLAGHTGRINVVAFSADGKWIVTTSRDKTAKLWDANTGCELATLAGHLEDVVSAEFVADDSSILTVSADNTARLWRIVSLDQEGN